MACVAGRGEGDLEGGREGEREGDDLCNTDAFPLQTKGGAVCQLVPKPTTNSVILTLGGRSSSFHSPLVLTFNPLLHALPITRMAPVKAADMHEIKSTENRAQKSRNYYVDNGGISIEFTASLSVGLRVKLQRGTPTEFTAVLPTGLSRTSLCKLYSLARLITSS